MGALTSKWAFVILPLHEIKRIRTEMGTSLQLSTHVEGVVRRLQPAFSLKFLEHPPPYPVWRKNNWGLPTVSVRGLTPQSVSHSPLNPPWFPPLFSTSPIVPALPRSTETAAVTLGHFFRGVNHVGDEPTLHALPALLDCDVTRPHQGEDVPGQLGEGVLHVDGVTGRRLDVAHPVRPRQLLCLLAGHLEDEMRLEDTFTRGNLASQGLVDLSHTLRTTVEINSGQLKPLVNQIVRGTKKPQQLNTGTK